MAEAAEMDRTKRYANPPKAPKKGGEANPEERKAKSEAEATAGGGMPHPKDPDKIGHVGADPGPEGGHDQTWGVVAERHKREHGDMLKRHAAEHVSHANMRHEMVERHHKEAKDMHGRHAKELADHFEQGAEASLERTAGSPEMLGKTKSEGKDGSEP